MKSLGADTNAYYRYHAKIYDLSRWAFLFGRKEMVAEIAALKPKRVLEVGCGTGKNLIELKKLAPEIECIGIDASRDMLEIAKSKSKSHSIQWVTSTYPSEQCDKVIQQGGVPDVILFSYALSMFNPGWESGLERAHQQVDKLGYVCVVDFHDSCYEWFRTWMSMNHVRMQAHLLPKIQELGEVQKVQQKSGLGGLWIWMMAISRANSA
jgi:S-adenosylmethionine-diacylgycerolhomoserine-N-methlytransferase